MSGTSPACKGQGRAEQACGRHIQHRCPKLRRTQESPEMACIGDHAPIRGMATSRAVTDKGPRPPVERAKVATGLEQGHPRRPCPKRALSTGPQRSSTDNHGRYPFRPSCKISPSGAVRGSFPSSRWPRSSAAAILPSFCPTDLHRTARRGITLDDRFTWTPADQGECNSDEPCRTDLNQRRPNAAPTSATSMVLLGALMWKLAPYSVKSILSASRERWRANLSRGRP
jgi:hypothetical protein